LRPKSCRGQLGLILSRPALVSRRGAQLRQRMESSNSQSPFLGFACCPACCDYCLWGPRHHSIVSCTMDASTFNPAGAEIPAEPPLTVPRLLCGGGIQVIQTEQRDFGTLKWWRRRGITTTAIFCSPKNEGKKRSESKSSISATNKLQVISGKGYGILGFSPSIPPIKVAGRTFTRFPSATFKRRPRFKAVTGHGEL